MVWVGGRRVADRVLSLVETRPASVPHSPAAIHGRRPLGSRCKAEGRVAIEDQVGKALVEGECFPQGPDSSPGWVGEGDSDLRQFTVGRAVLGVEVPFWRFGSMAGAGPLSIRENARRVGRAVTVVHLPA